MLSAAVLLLASDAVSKPPCMHPMRSMQHVLFQVGSLGEHG